MVSYVKIFNLLKDNNEFSFIKNLKLEEAHKLLDFQKVFNQNINPNNDQEIKAVSYLLFFTVAKVYLNYKDACPTVSVEDDPYKYYVIQPTNGSYQLLDYLINKLIDTVQKIEISNSNQYDYGHKILHLNNSRYGDIGDNISTDYDINSYNLEIAKLYLKSISHELGHALHCYHYEDNDGLIIPAGYATYYEKLYNRKATKNDFVNRIKNYEKLSLKYNIIKVDEKTPVITSHNCLPSETIGWDNRDVEEAFTEMEAEDYANLDNPFTRYIDNNIIFISKTLDNGYTLGANYLRSYLNIIPKKDQFKVAFLGKDPTINIKDYSTLEDALHVLICNSDGEFSFSNDELLHLFSKLYKTLIDNNSDPDPFLFPIIKNSSSSVLDYYQDYLDNNNSKQL
ncbi:MAG: hypothetical protein IKE63_03080 [Bacilli bacterium]|nr:hypothetical protein [Bacilli bacterium]